MNYLIVQSFFDNIFSLVLEHRITLGIFWFFLFGYFLWRLSKKDNDFVLKINVDPILKMDLPIPPGGPMEILKDISHLEVASNSGKTSGTGTMKLAFTNKSKNSLSEILKIINAINTIVPEGEINF